MKSLHTAYLYKPASALLTSSDAFTLSAVLKKASCPVSVTYQELLKLPIGSLVLIYKGGGSTEKHLAVLAGNLYG